VTASKYAIADKTRNQNFFCYRTRDKTIQKKKTRDKCKAICPTCNPSVDPSLSARIKADGAEGEGRRPLLALVDPAARLLDEPSPLARSSRGGAAAQRELHKRLCGAASVGAIRVAVAAGHLAERTLTVDARSNLNEGGCGGRVRETRGEKIFWILARLPPCLGLGSFCFESLRSVGCGMDAQDKAKGKTCLGGAKALATAAKTKIMLPETCLVVCPHMQPYMPACAISLSSINNHIMLPETNNN